MIFSDNDVLSACAVIRGDPELRRGRAPEPCDGRRSGRAPIITTAGAHLISLTKYYLPELRL